MYYKSFKHQFTSSIARDPMLRVVFNDMCALADRDGNVHMNYEMIAAITKWSVETIMEKIAELMKPDPDSRSKRNDGIRLILINPDRPWGWHVVNYERYRNMRSSNDRRAYMRELMREKRKRKKLAPVSNVLAGVSSMLAGVSTTLAGVSTTLADAPVSDSENGTSDTELLAPVSTRYHVLAHADTDTDTEEEPPAVPQGGQLQADPSDFITDFREAKRIICERVLNGKDPNRLWSVDAYQRLLKHLPIPRQEIERVAWFRTKSNDGSPELEARKPITETGLMAYWGDEVTRANAYWEKLYGWREKKKAAG